MWITAFVLGFAGSLHCLGMCSPLAMAVTNLRKPFLLNRVVYNGGRILTYGILGAGVSIFGSLFKLSGFQNILTIALGVALVIIGLAGSNWLRIPFLTRAMGSVTGEIKSLFAGFLQKKTMLSMTFMGMLNGLLPCGLTYLALTWCLTMTDGASGFLFMLIFGAGTLPAMLGFTSLLQEFITRFNFSLRSFTTVAMIALGALLISRSAYVHYHEHEAHGEEAVVICK